MNNESLFIKIWRNKYIKNHIIKFIKNDMVQGSIKRLRYYNYYEMNQVEEIVLFNKELLRDKVYRGEILKFTFKGSKIPFGDIFENYHDEEIDGGFYMELFKNYPKYFTTNDEDDGNHVGGLLDSTALYLTLSNCFIGFKILVQHFHYIPNSNIFYKSIQVGSIEISKFINKHYGNNCKLTENQQISIWNDLLNKDYSKCFNSDYWNGTVGKRNKSIHYLIEINTRVPKLLFPKLIYADGSKSTKFTSLIDFSIKSQTLQFVLDMCYSIVFLKESICNFKFLPFTNKHPNAIKKILSIHTLNQYKQSFTKEQLETKVKYLPSDGDDSGGVAIKEISRMSIWYTSSSHFRDNLMFCNVKFDCNYFPSHSHESIKKLAFCNGDYEKLKEINGFPSNYNKSFKLFQFIKQNTEKQIQFVKLAVADILKPDLKSNERMEAPVLFIFLIVIDNVDLVELFINQMDFKKNGTTFKLPNHSSSYIKSPEMFELIYQKHFNESFQTIIPTYQSIHSYKPTTVEYWEYMVTNDRGYFYFDKLKKDKYLNSAHYNDSIDQTVPILSMPMWKFIKWVENTPHNQDYSCLNSIEKYNWVLNNKPEDIKSGKCKLRVLNQFIGGFDVSTIPIKSNTPTKIQILYYENNFTNLNIDSFFKQEEHNNNGDGGEELIKQLFNKHLISSIIKRLELDNLKIVIDYHNQFSNEKIQNPKISSILEESKSNIINSIGIYNSLSVLSFIFNQYPNFITPKYLRDCQLISISFGSMDYMGALNSLAKYTLANNSASVSFKSYE